MRPYSVLCILLASNGSRAWTIGSPRLERSLFKRAVAVRKKINTPLPELLGHGSSSASLAHPSAYSKPDGSGMRGFCNWLIPDRLMVGQYPGQNPERAGPTPDDVYEHVRAVVQDANISLFCSLQSEIPSQMDDKVWRDGGAYLPQQSRKDFPNPFTHYAPVVRSVATTAGARDPLFLHSPIPDLSVPTSKPLQKLAGTLLKAIEEDDRVIYLHCWGGRGRAGLVGACLVSLIYPELEPSAVLNLVQEGYDSRAGAQSMLPQLARSPQTMAQREFVEKFVLEQQRQRTAV